MTTDSAIAVPSSSTSTGTRCHGLSPQLGRAQLTLHDLDLPERQRDSISPRERYAPGGDWRAVRVSMIRMANALINT
jgi:hypothetical protein